MIAGVVVVDKPAGPTSHDVVVSARRALGERRIGHCGTLDPMATGVLVLAIGSATRLVSYLSAATKHYDAVIRFGRESTTWDAAGEIVAESDARPSSAALDEALEAFRGESMQTPPAYSAKRVGGERAYTLARRAALPGSALRPVPVVCHQLTLTAFDGERAWLSLAVSAGFYVRSLAHDLGRRLGSGALLEALRRTRSGQFTADDAVPFEAVVAGDPAAVLARAVAMEALLPEVPALALSDEEAQGVRHGRDLDRTVPGASLVRLLDPDARLLALAVPGRRPGALHPSVVLG